MENYAIAAIRHYRDAELLEKEDRTDNADHHYGFAAECAIKKALVSFPVFLASGKLEQSYKQHINTLWYKTTHQSLQKSYPQLIAILKGINAFSNWDVNQRYLIDGAITSEALAFHKKSAKRLIGAVGLQGSRAI